MDLDDFRSILDTAGVDVWVFIDSAIAVASADYGGELKRRRDGIVERLYAATSVPPRCRNCEANDEETKKRSKSSTEEDEDEDEEELDPFGGLFDEEQKRILEIKQQLEDPHQSEDSLVELLQNLADMDITYQALEETDIGRHVNRLKKHSSNEVRRLAKLLVRKWKEIVDEWVMLKAPGEPATVIAGDEDSPQQKNRQNGHHQIPDFAYSPNPHNGNFGSERNYSSEAEAEPKPKPKTIPRKEAPPKPAPSPSVPTPSPAPQNRQRESNFDSERLASARKRLQENYKEAANAKKQRTIQVMDLHELPKPKNAFFAKNKGGVGSQGRHW